MSDYLCIAPDVKLGHDVKLSKFVNLYGCAVGDNTKIGAFVEIQKNAKVGKNCKISSHTFICEGVTIEDNVFIGHGVMFINDSYPRATSPHGGLQTERDWRVEPTLVRQGASIGSGATILANVTQIAYTNVSSRTLTTSSCTQSGGTLSLILADLVLTASGAVGPFRYIYIVNTSSTTRTNALIGYYDYGSSISLALGETFTLDLDNVNGLLQIA